jgi:hypothetical protein
MKAGLDSGSRIRYGTSFARMTKGRVRGKELVTLTLPSPIKGEEFEYFHNNDEYGER